MPFWSVVRSQSQRERFAAEQLGLRGFETFLPMVQTKRATAPLFTGYFFVRIVEQWRSINFCFGHTDAEGRNHSLLQRQVLDHRFYRLYVAFGPFTLILRSNVIRDGRIFLSRD